MNEKTFEYLKCGHCFWVHFSVTREHAENEVAEFNRYFDSLSKEKQELHYGGKGSSIVQYEYCGFCGSTYKDFVPAIKVPNGSTISPIIKE